MQMVVRFIPEPNDYLSGHLAGAAVKTVKGKAATWAGIE